MLHALLLATFCLRASLSFSTTNPKFQTSPGWAAEMENAETKESKNESMSNGVQSRLTMPPAPASPKTWTFKPPNWASSETGDVYYAMTRKFVPAKPVTMHERFITFVYNTVAAFTFWPAYEQHTLFDNPVSINLEEPRSHPPPPPRSPSKSPRSFPPHQFFNHPMMSNPNENLDCGDDNSTDKGNLTNSVIKPDEDRDSVNGKVPVALILISSCNSFLALLALILNTILVLHYKKHLTSIPSLLYFRNGLCDIISAIGFLLQVPSVISILKEHTPTILPLLSFWITTISVRMSVFMNCLLGVVRCINILNPFYLINKKIITLSTSLYILIWTSIASLDVWVYITKITLQNRVYLVKSLVLKAEPGFSLTSLSGSGGAVLTSLSQAEIVLVQFLTPLVLPALLCFVLMVFQILHLRKQSFAVTPQVSTRKEEQGSNKEKDLKQRTNRRKNKAATSILIVTIIYVLTSTVSVAMWLVIYREHLGGGEKIKKLSWSELSVIYFSTSTLPLLCSTLTPLTLLVRGNILKLYTRDTFKKIMEFSTRKNDINQSR